MLPALPTGMQRASSSSGERLIDLEGAGLLALDPELVDRVDQRDRVAGGEPADELQGDVEVAAQRDHPGTVHQRLGQLAGGDLAVGDDHRAAQPGPGGVGGRRGGGVAGGGAHDRPGALADGRRHRTGHAAVLERPRRVQPLELAPHLDAGLPRQAGRVHQRSRALAQGHDRVIVGERQPLPVALDEASHRAGACQSGENHFPVLWSDATHR